MKTTIHKDSDGDLNFSIEETCPRCEQLWHMCKCEDRTGMIEDTADNVVLDEHGCILYADFNEKRMTFGCMLTGGPMGG